MCFTVVCSMFLQFQCVFTVVVCFYSCSVFFTVVVCFKVVECFTVVVCFSVVSSMFLQL